MRLATIKRYGLEKAAIITGQGAVLVESVNKTFNLSWAENIYDIIQTGQLTRMTEWYKTEGKNLLEDYHQVIPTEDIGVLA
jgi:hypothetical protein